MPSAATVAELQVVVGADVSAAEKGLDSLGKKVGNTGSLIATAFTGAAVAGIAGLAAGLGASVSAASDFEKSMSGVKAVSGATAAEMENLSKLALQLGADTSFSAQEAADGIGELVKAGVSMGDIMGGAGKASLDLAAAGGIAVADAATIAAQALNLFSLKGEDMGHVADLIAGAANASAIDVNQFKFSLQEAGAVASSTGVSFEDTATAIALLGQSGITGQKAGTSLSNMLLRLQPQTKEQTELFQKLGLETKKGGNAFFDQQGKVKNLAQVAGILQNATKGMTEQQKISTFQTLFGNDAMAAAVAMTKAGATGFAEMADAMGKVSAADVASTRLDNLSGSIEKMTGSLSTMAITIGLALTPVLRTMVDWATETINAWMPTIKLWADQVPAAIDATVATLKAQLQPVLAWFTTTGLPLLTAAFGLVTTYITSIFLPMLAGLWAALSPTGGGGLGSALTWLTVTGFPMLQGAMLAVGTWLATVWLPTVQQVVSWLWDKVGATLTWLSTTAWPLLQAAMVVVGAWVMSTLVPTLTAAWSWLTEKVGAGLTWLAETAWPKLGEAANKVQGWIKDTLIPTLTDWYQWLDQKLQPIYTWFTTTGWPLLQQAGAAVWTWLTATLFPALSEWYDWLQLRLSPIFTWFTTTGWPLLQKAGAEVVAWVVGPLAAALKEWYEWLQDRLSPIFEWFSTTGWPAFQTAGAYVWTWLTTNLIPSLRDWYAWMGEKTKGAAQWWIGTGFPGLGDGAEDVTPKVGALTRAWEDFTTALGKTDAGESWVAILANLSAFGKYLIENIRLGDWFNDITNGAAAASGWADYIAEAIAWILRTIRKWTDAFPGRRDLPDVDAPPKPPSGNSGGGGGGGSGAVPAPPDFTAPPNMTPTPSPSPSPSPSPTPSPTPSPSPAPGGAVPPGIGTERRGGGMEVENYIRSVASNLGIDPSVAVAVANTEGGARDYMRIGDFRGPPWYSGVSYWPFQLHYGGPGTPYAAWGSTAGMGNDFTAAKHIQPGDWQGWQQSTLWALGIAKQDGWRQWYGAAAAGIGRWQGIPGHAAGGWAGLHGPELAWLGERGPEYVVPNHALRGDVGAAAMQTVRVEVAVGGRVAEEIYVTGRQLAIRRGRVPSGAGA